MNNYAMGQIKFLANQEQITHLEAQKNYSLVYFADGTKKLIAYNLKRIEEYLSNNYSFKRVHKSYIVNKNYVAKISDDGERLNLYNKTVIPLTYKMEYSA